MNRREFRTRIIYQLYQYDLLNKPSYEINKNVKKTFEGITTNLTKIDQLISKCLQNYTIDRLAYVDRAIIRLAVYEMLFTDTPKNIIINEAIEITKSLSDIDEKQVRFTNRLLDKIKTEIGE